QWLCRRCHAQAHGRAFPWGAVAPRLVRKRCRVCKKKFVVRAYERNRARYCSRPCQRQGRIKQVKKVCSVCGKSFMVKRSELPRPGRGKFCSVPCRMKGKFRSKKERFQEYVPLLPNANGCRIWQGNMHWNGYGR